MGLFSRLFGTKSDEPEPKFEVAIEVGGRSFTYEDMPADPGDPEKCWVPSGRSVSIHGYDIPDGLIYVGEQLWGVNRWSGVEPALINPKLAVNKKSPDRDGQTMTYWPSYSEISPAARAAFLEWLASGRSDPHAYIGYVFIYFYGLERRALADATQISSARQELPVIRHEVERLLGIYSHNRSFSSYASSFMDLLSTSEETGRGYDAEPPAPADTWQVPLGLKIALAHLALDEKPLSPSWALAWLECDPEVHLRTPAKRCHEEFRELFAAKYRELHGEGLVLKPNKTKIRARYRPASRSIGSLVDVPVGDLPDLTALTGPMKKLRGIAEECCNELDAYSRWLGRNPEGRGSLGAVALLPDALAASAEGTEVQSLVAWLETKLQEDGPLVNGAELIAKWPSSSPEKLSKAESVLLAEFLQKKKYGIEPDVRFGGPTLNSQMSALFFRLGDESPSAPSSSYVGGTVLLHLAAAVSTSDGSVTTAEEEHLERHMETSLDLNPGEPERLRAHLQWLLANPPSLTGLKKRLEHLKASQRDSIGQFLVSVAGADGHVAPAEITMLKKVYRLLGLETDAVFSHVHALSVSPATVPVTIRPASTSKTGVSIPGKPSPDAEVNLDMGAVAAKLDETATVAALLGDVFADEEDVSVAPAVLPESSVAGLDSSHSAFVRALIERDTWNRAELEELAEQLGVLPDGAVELVNDAAFEVAGEPLCEGDDVIYVDKHVSEEMLS